MNKNLPIVVNSSSWTMQEKSMIRSFKFEKRKTSEFFIFEMLKFLRDTVADIEFRKRDNNVIIVIRAFSPAISEIEIESSKKIEEIYEDVMYYKQ